MSRHIRWRWDVYRFVLGFLLVAISPVCSFAEVVASSAPFVRFEVLPVDGGELLTLFFRDRPESGNQQVDEVPLISVFRDTLGSSDPSVHHLRYVWVHTYAAPALKQRFIAATPFPYGGLGSAGKSKSRVPAPVMDLSLPEDRLWKSVWELALKVALLDPRISLIQSVFNSYGENRSLFLQTQFARASTAMDMADASEFPVLTDAERRLLQQRFAQRNNGLAPLLNETQLQRFYLKEMIAMRRDCARNWELLRQRAEAEGLYFEPLLLPDGTATHAILWVAREDVEGKKDARFNDRFLSIGKPWGDEDLLNWKGPTEIRYFDSLNRRVSSSAGATKQVELIPLALYGLDHPKIPALLIDFRDPLNAKSRELSRRAVDEIGAQVSTGSGFVNLMLRAGRTGAGVVTRRLGMDLFQPSRFLSYSQLKMVLSTSPNISAAMRQEIARRAGSLGMNPFETDLATELRLARSQYQALMEYARRPNGLRADLERDRRAELMTSTHSGGAKFAFRVANVLTFGRYRHREKEQPGLDATVERQRRNLNNARLLEEVVRSGPHIDVLWDSEKVRDALRGVFANASLPDETLSDTAFLIFDRSQDEETRRLCLASLYYLDTPSSRKKLLAVASNPTLDAKWRTLSANYLNGITAENAAVDAND